jgi:uncharacterized protein YehS (DUF1456 family)
MENFSKIKLVTGLIVNVNLTVDCEPSFFVNISDNIIIGIVLLDKVKNALAKEGMIYLFKKNDEEIYQPCGDIAFYQGEKGTTKWNVCPYNTSDISKKEASKLMAEEINELVGLNQDQIETIHSMTSFPISLGSN